MRTFSKWQRLASLLTTLVFFFVITSPIGCGSEEGKDAESSTNDPSTQNTVYSAEQMEYWIAKMDPYVTQNEDWAFTFDREGFLQAITESHPEVVAYYKANGVATMDTEIIDNFLEGFLIANEEMLAQYEAYKNLPEGSYPAIWSKGYWWGRKVCYSGSDADLAEQFICYEALLLGPLVPIPAVYIGICCYDADNCNDKYSQFCVNYTWVGIFWVSCS